MTATIYVSRVDPEGNVLEEERAATESLTTTGARISTELRLVDGETVWLVGAGPFTGWASVRRTWRGDDGSSLAELDFMPDPGQGPAGPASSRPAAPLAVRVQDRLVFRLAVLLMRLGPDGALLEKERTVTENISPGGARVQTRMTSIRVGDRVALEERRGSFRTWATVRGLYTGEDGLVRLNLRFDKPLELPVG